MSRQDGDKGVIMSNYNTRIKARQEKNISFKQQFEKLLIGINFTTKIKENEEREYYKQYFIKGKKLIKQRVREPKKYYRARIVEQGRITDITITNFRPKPQIKKINMTEYVILKTGEVKEFMKKERISEDDIMRNRRSLKVIFKELRQTINYNFASEYKNQLAITLTYSENMQDEKQLYSDFDKFIKRLKHNHPDDKFEYIVIVEPQARGAWHCHLLLKSMNQDDLYISHEKMEKLWGHGATRTERLKNVDQYGAYFIAYLSNAEITDDDIEKMNIEENDITEKDGKRFIKGLRLKWYPEHMRIWRHSKGIKKPKYYDLLGEEVKSHLHKYGTITYEKIHELQTKDNKPLEIINQQRKK